MLATVDTPEGMGKKYPYPILHSNPVRYCNALLPTFAKRFLPPIQLQCTRPPIAMYPSPYCNAPPAPVLHDTPPYARTHRFGTPPVFLPLAFTRIRYGKKNTLNSHTHTHLYAPNTHSQTQLATVASVIVKIKSLIVTVIACCLI